MKLTLKIKNIKDIGKITKQDLLNFSSVRTLLKKQKITRKDFSKYGYLIYSIEKKKIILYMGKYRGIYDYEIANIPVEKGPWGIEKIKIL